MGTRDVYKGLSELRCEFGQDGMTGHAPGVFRCSLIALVVLLACRPSVETPDDSLTHVTPPDEFARLDAGHAVPVDSPLRIVAPSVGELRSFLAFVGRRLHYPPWRQAYLTGMPGDALALLDIRGLNSSRPASFALLSLEPVRWLIILPTTNVDQMQAELKAQWPEWSMAALEWAELVFIGNDAGDVHTAREDADIPGRALPVWDQSRWHGHVRPAAFLPLWDAWIARPILSTYPEAEFHLLPVLTSQGDRFARVPPLNLTMTTAERSTRIEIGADSEAMPDRDEEGRSFETGWFTVPLSPEPTNIAAAILRSLSAATTDKNLMDNTERFLNLATGPATIALTEEGAWLLAVSVADAPDMKHILQDTLPPDPATAQFDLGGVLVHYALVGKTRICYTLLSNRLILAVGPEAEAVLLNGLQSDQRATADAFFSGSIHLDKSSFPEPFWINTEEDQALWQAILQTLHELDWEFQGRPDRLVGSMRLVWGPMVDPLAGESVLSRAR